MRPRLARHGYGLAGLLALGCAEGPVAPADARVEADAERVEAGDASEPVEIDATTWAALLALSPETLPPMPPDVSNRHADDPAAAAFGRRLFFEPIFSGRLLDGDNDGRLGTLGQRGDTGRVSCASCHVPTSGFVDDRSPSAQISLGAGWGRRRAPSLLDVGRARLLMWDGRRDALYNQVFGPIESPVEMNSSRLYAAQQVFAHHRAEYESIFGPMPPLDDATRFPPIAADATGCTPRGLETPVECDGTTHGMPGDGAEFDGMSAEDQAAVTRVVADVGRAIGAYERLLECGTSRFDAFMRGDPTALDAREQRGAVLFVGRAGCVRCHSGPFFSDQRFHVVGVAPEPVAVIFSDEDDHGASVGLASAIADPLNVRGDFSDGDDGRLPELPLSAALEGAFRTPTLRCVARRPSFMHTGELRSLEAVVEHFDRGGDRDRYFGTNELTPLGLGASERADLVAFLRALTGPGPDPSLLGPP